MYTIYLNKTELTLHTVAEPIQQEVIDVNN